MTDWANVCVLCSTRNRQTRLQYGHCCAGCADRLLGNLRAIVELATMASVTPKAGAGGYSAAYGSKPPLLVDALDPELTPIGPPPSPTVLDVLESWTKMVREEQGLGPYGPWTASHQDDTLTVVVRFLTAHHEWIISQPDFPLEDYASEITACVRVLRRWDTEAEDLGTMVKCPTLTEEGECGYRLYYRDWTDHVTCRRCNVTRDASTLVVVAMSDGREVWLDPEAAAKWLGVTERTLRQWARKGSIRRAHGRYCVKQQEVKP